MSRDTLLEQGTNVTETQQTEAHAAHAMLRGLLEAAPDAMMVVRPDGTIAALNSQLCRMFGYDRDELLGGPLEGLVPERFRDTHLHHRGRYFGEPRTRPMGAGLDLRGRRKDGSEFAVEISLSPMQTDAGPLVTAAVRDISERKLVETRLRTSLEEEQRRFRLLVESVREYAIFMLDLQGRILTWNRGAEEVQGYRAEEIIGRHVSRFFPEEDVAAGRPERELGFAVESGRFEDEVWRVRKDGSRFWASVVITPVFGEPGQVTGYATVTRDLTERKRAEDALLEADRRKNEFLGMLSHELRNPLAPIRNSLYILARATPGGEQALRAMRVIERQVQHTTRLVDDLLDVTRITRGKIRLQRERVDLGELARRTAEDHRELFAKSGVLLDVTVEADPVIVVADPVRVVQVIGNLLHNSVKFTPRGGSTTLAVERGQGFGIVTVRDTGAGLGPEVLPHLFEPFVQADRTLDRSPGGLGLGLALVKGLAELHGGSVVAQSAGAGRGATFTVRLPLERRDAPRAKAEPAPGAPRSVQRVLAIEDNIDAAETLREALELNGHAVDIALTGSEGLAKVRSFKPDVVLCDLGLPGMDGFQVARTIRADPSADGVPLVALSGYAQPEDLERSRSAGFDLHLAKPVDLDVLERILAELLQAVAARSAAGEPASPPGGS